MSESKIKVALIDDEIEILANREGMKFLSDICYGLSQLSDDESKTPANHWHIDEFMNTAEKDSIRLMITLKTDL